MKNRSAGPWVLLRQVPVCISCWLQRFSLAPKKSIKRRVWGLRWKYIGGQMGPSLERMGSHSRAGGTGGKCVPAAIGHFPRSSCQPQGSGRKAILHDHIHLFYITFKHQDGPGDICQPTKVFIIWDSVFAIETDFFFPEWFLVPLEFICGDTTSVPSTLILQPSSQEMQISK